jgi:hypothetical protein
MPSHILRREESGTDNAHGAMYNSGMTITINITPELESQLREQAAKQGLDASEYIVNALQKDLRQPQNQYAPSLPEAEAHLLQQINQGLPPEFWQRYHELLDKRRAETLAPDEQATLITLSDQIEEFNARRIECLIQLARLRQTSLPALMEQRGIKTPSYV